MSGNISSVLSIFGSGRSSGRKFVILCKNKLVICCPEDCFDPVNKCFNLSINQFKNIVVNLDDIENYTLIGR